MADAETFITEGMGNLQDGDAEAALAAFTQAVTFDPEHGQAWYAKGCAHAALDQHQEAVAAYQQSAQVAGDRAALPLFNMGNSYQELGQMMDAVEAFQAATKADPLMTDAWVNLGRILDDFGQHQSAIDCYELALQVEPEDAMAWSNRGNSLRGLGDFEKALESYRRALDIDPEDLASRLGSGACMVECDRSKEGLDVLQEVLEQTQHPLAMFELGTAFARVGMHDAAVTMYDTLVDNDFETSEVWNNRGECLAQLERIDESIKSFDSAIEVDADFGPAYFGKARVLVNSERLDEAKPVVARFLELADEEERDDPAVKALVACCGL